MNSAAQHLSVYKHIPYIYVKPLATERRPSPFTQYPIVQTESGLFQDLCLRRCKPKEHTRGLSVGHRFMETCRQGRVSRAGRP